VSNKNGPARVKRRMHWEAPSKPLAVDDPLLLPEREVHAEIGINWVLDQEILKGGYVRILAESLLWEERLCKTRIRTTECLTTCMELHRGWTIASSSWIFLRKRWLDREQELIMIIQEETEEKEEAASERAFPVFFGDIFGCSTLSKKRCYSTEEFTRFLSTVSSQRRATRSDVSFQVK